MAVDPCMTLHFIYIEGTSQHRVREHIYLVLLSIVMQKVLSLL